MRLNLDAEAEVGGPRDIHVAVDFEVGRDGGGGDEEIDRGF